MQNGRSDVAEYNPPLFLSPFLSSLGYLNMKNNRRFHLQVAPTPQMREITVDELFVVSSGYVVAVHPSGPRSDPSVGYSTVIWQK